MGRRDGRAIQESFVGKIPMDRSSQDTEALHRGTSLAEALPRRGDILGRDTETLKGLGKAMSLICSWKKEENDQR